MISINGNSASAYPHVNGSGAFPNRDFALRFTLFACDSRGKNGVVVLEQVNEEDCKNIKMYSKRSDGGDSRVGWRS